MNHKNYLITRIKLKLFFALFLAFTVNVAMGQNNTVNAAIGIGNRVQVSGAVRDVSGETIPGVSIFIKNTNRGTISDSNGKFTIAASANEALTFSMVGYQPQTIEVGKSKELNVTLVQSDRTLDELVVIGYGSIKKKDLTGAMSVIKPDAIKNTSALSVGDAIQGLASGVKIRSNGSIGAEPTVQIRGIGNFGNGEPLYIIDDQITIGGIRDLNVNDIASVQILKDASTAAIYGNRAANGVIIITTKKGQLGHPRVNFSSKIGMDILPGLNLMDTTEFFKYNDMAYKNAGLTPQNHYKNSTNWEKEILKRGFSKDVNLDISGATSKFNYLVSGNYFNIKGTSIGTNLDRYSLRVNTEYKSGKFLVGEKVAITKTQVTPSSSGNPLTDAIRMTPDMAVYDTSHVGGFGYGDEARARTFGTNSIAVQNLSRIENRNTRIRGTVYGEAQITSWLKYRASFGYETSIDGSNQYRTVGNWTLNQPYEPNKYYDFHARYQSILLENFITIDKKIEDHTFNLMLGASRQDQNYFWKSTEIKGFTSWDDSGLKILDATNADTTVINPLKGALSLRSYFSRLNYDYDNRYLVSLSIRRDASSQFSKALRVGYFPSVALGWIVSNEKFFNVPFVSNLKLKANYGALGNSAIANWGALSGLYDYSGKLTTYPLYTFGADNLQAGATQRQLANSNLTWETKKITNLGAELGFFKNRLQISGDYFIARTEDVLLNYPILLATGNDGGDPWVNAGTLENRGVELEINWNDKIGDFKYSVSANFTKLKNKVLDLPYFDQSITTGLCKTTINQPLAMFYLIKSDGIFQTAEEVQQHVNSTGVVIQPNAKPGDLRLVDYNDDGIISEAGDRQIAGSPWPVLEAGLNLSASYKNLDFSLQGFGAFGQKIWNGYRALTERFADNSNYVKGINPWTAENTNTTMPRLLYADDRNVKPVYDIWLEDGSFFKIQQLALGYNIPIKKIYKNIESARIAISAQNFHTFTKYTGLDPEFQNNYKLEFGVDGVSYPTPKSYLFTINVTF
ncbi:MAG: TonB-dependent receptor [Paludibacter sp.]|nr:TonB-dependent receptor [Paludibacter sp.]